MIQIIPAVLAKTEVEYREAVDKISQSEALKNGWVHIDFADNKFVPNQTISPELTKIHPTTLNLEAHLMVENPASWISVLKEIGFKRVIAHIESGSEEINEFISGAKVQDLEIGLAINMDTPLEKLKPYWEVIDLVLVMAIEPGFQGQPFLSESVNRIKEIRDICSKLDKPFMIGVDGHINDQTIKVVIEAGADHLVVGSYLLRGEIDENLEKIWEAIKS